MSSKLATTAAMQPDPKALMRLPGVLALLPVSRMYVLKAVDAGTFPAPFKLSERVCVWRRQTVLDWIAEREEASRKADAERRAKKTAKSNFTNLDATKSAASSSSTRGRRDPWDDE